MENAIGKSNIIHLSNLRNLSLRCSLSTFLPDWLLIFISASNVGNFLFFLKYNIRAYSTIAPIMKIRQYKIQYIIAVTYCPDFGEYLADQFRMLIMHRNNVVRKPILPGTVSIGIRKLICNKSSIFKPCSISKHLISNHETNPWNNHEHPGW